MKEQLLLEARNKSIENISNFISKHINGASLTRQMNNTLSYTLPYSQKINFEDFFKALDKNRASLDICSYGISDTTLEEIFLMLTTRDINGDLLTPLTSANTSSNNDTSILSKVQNLSTSFESDKDSGVAIELGSADVTATLGSKSHFAQQILNPMALGLNASLDSVSHTQLTNFEKPIRYSKSRGKQLYAQQFVALLLKRLHHYRRNMRVFFTNILLPCIFVALSMGFTTIRPKLTDQASLEMSPKIYSPNNYFMT